jgi:hypothetical protein
VIEDTPLWIGRLGLNHIAWLISRNGSFGLGRTRRRRRRNDPNVACPSGPHLSLHPSCLAPSMSGCTAFITRRKAEETCAPVASRAKAKTTEYADARAITSFNNRSRAACAAMHYDGKPCNW